MTAAVPLSLTLLLLVARVAGVPALSDPVAGTTPEKLTLHVPAVYLLMGPVFSTWDGISMLSMTRLKGFLVGLVVLYLAWRILHAFINHRRGYNRRRLLRRVKRELAVLAVSVMGLLVFLILGAVWHRPMLSLSGTSPGERVVDFHSHTNSSHDVEGTWMKNFDLDANLRWHARAGFDAVFITDHNAPRLESQVSGGLRPWSLGSALRSDESQRENFEPDTDGQEPPERVTAGCPGIEVSAWRSHVVLLGDTLPVDRGQYNQSLESLLQLLRTSERAYGSLSVASLPEYRRNHWTRLDTLIDAGLDGFEIVNASPKANELTRAERDTVIALARTHDRFVLGVSDSHGWGATSMVWNLVPVPPGTQAAGICRAVLDQLRSGFGVLRVIERHRLRPESRWPMLLTPLGMMWETWRSMGWPLTASWILWIWVVWGRAYRRRNRL